MNTERKKALPRAWVLVGLTALSGLGCGTPVYGGFHCSQLALGTSASSLPLGPRVPYRNLPGVPPPGTPSFDATRPTARATADFKFCAQNPDELSADGGELDCPAMLARVALSQLEGQYVEGCGTSSSPWTPPPGLSVCTVALDGDSVVGVAVHCFD